jgi:hypothetical protein
VKEAEIVYRNKITKLEEVRCQIHIGREKGKILLNAFENETFKAIKDSFYLYGNSVQVASNNMRNGAEKFESVVHYLPPFHFDPAQFELIWRPIDPVFFEDYSTGLDLQDLVFGVPLPYSIRMIPDVIPPFLKYSIQEIERRGLDLEGLYRVAGKSTERVHWKAKIEMDISKVDFSTIDVHVLTGLVKEFFRELPEPLFPVPSTDRVFYANIPNVDDRLLHLKSRLHSLSRINMSVLKYLIEHLQR